jgi:hypothetical protein
MLDQRVPLRRTRAVLSPVRLAASITLASSVLLGAGIAAPPAHADTPPPAITTAQSSAIIANGWELIGQSNYALDPGNAWACKTVVSSIYGPLYELHLDLQSTFPPSGTWAGGDVVNTNVYQPTVTALMSDHEVVPATEESDVFVNRLAGSALTSANYFTVKLLDVNLDWISMTSLVANADRNPDPNYHYPLVSHLPTCL